jgi:hypothetical protein
MVLFSVVLPLIVAGAGEMCNFHADTAFEAALDKFQQKVQATSKEECCAVCQGTPQCFVGNYVAWNGTYPPYSKNTPVHIYGSCWMRGKINTSQPTTKSGTTACLVEEPAPKVKAAPKGAKNVLYIVADDMRPDLPCYGQSQVIAPNFDHFAKTAMVFDRAYCQQSICSPSRNR